MNKFRETRLKISVQISEKVILKKIIILNNGKSLGLNKFIFLKLPRLFYFHSKF